MSILSWLPFLFASPPPSQACATQGPLLLEIRAGSDTATAVATTRIYTSGGWTASSGGGTERGCFDRRELRAIRRAVLRAPWGVTTSPIACFAHDPNFTQYVVRGKLRYTERMCSGATADATTTRAIALVHQELAEDRRPAPLPPPPPPPAPVTTSCSTTGTPLFEIRRREEGTAESTRIALHGSGAWTVTSIDKHGRTSAPTTRCLGRKALAPLHAAVTRAPWDTTISRIVCKAYSPNFTEYHVRGKLEHTARMCGAERLDDESRRAIEIVETALVP